MSGNGNSTGFRPEEIVQVQGREFPLIGGRLRIAHERDRERLSIQTELVTFVLEDHAIVRATVETAAGTFSATGTANVSRDSKLQDALLELAETRAVARALRFAGVGVECCGFEELGDRPDQEGQAPAAGTGPSFSSRPPSQPIPAPPGVTRSRTTPATGAQRRALRALAHQLGQEVDSVVLGVYPGHDIESLSLAQASQLIDRLKSRTGTGNGNGSGHSIGAER